MIVFPVGDGITLAELIVGVLLVVAVVGLLLGPMVGALAVPAAPPAPRLDRLAWRMFVSGVIALVMVVVVLLAAALVGA